MTQHLEQEIFGAEEPSDPGSGRPQRRLGQSLAALFIAVGVVLGIGYGVYRVAEPVVSEFVASDDFDGPGSGTAEVVVAQGDTGRVIAASLVRAGVVKTSSAFLSASSDNPGVANKIQPGTYTLRKEMRAADALKMLADPANRSVPRVTIPEGLWASEVYERLSKQSEIPIKEYRAAAKDAEALGLPAVAKGNVEGWLFPNTYEFPEDSTAAEQLAQMVQQAVRVMTDLGIPEDQWQDTMIMASIIESEAGSDEDRPKVARVFYNRLETQGEPTNGLLQSDATVSYGAGRRAIVPTSEEINDDNPYNTRLNPGLPAGPISNPGQASIEAAANPADGPWFFFVTTNPETGETKFAETLEEHNRNVQEFEAWCAENEDQC